MPQGVLDGAAADRSHASCIVHLRTNSLTVAAAAAACCCLLSLSLLLSLLSQANQLEPPGATELLVPAGAAVVWRTAVWHCVSTHTHTTMSACRLFGPPPDPGDSAISEANESQEGREESYLAS